MGSGYADAQPVEDHDILVIGAGISGINTTHVLRAQMPHRSVAILEKRPVLGGTWNLFRYPGVRSDSYMTAFGLGWYPWPKKHKVAPAAEILEYLGEAADKDGITPLIRFSHEVRAFEWKSGEKKWRLDVDADGVRKTFVANFIICAMGYYADDKALEAVIPGIDDFGGQVVHTQWWPEDLDYSNKRIVLIGSGATAVTLLPELVKEASHVTMLQRSPSYVVANGTRTIVDQLADSLLPKSWASVVTRWHATTIELVFSQLLLAFPNVFRNLLMKGAKAALPKKVDAHVHFNPRYYPMEQRLCLTPSGEFFTALHKDNCEIVTDTIETVTKGGVQLASGRKLDADIIVTATGLYFQLFGGLKPVVDGEVLEVGSHYTWRGMLVEDLPNMAFVMGNTTTSWTPAANIMAHLAVKLLKRMEKKGAAAVVPKIERRDGMPAHMAVDVKSNYFLQAADRMPKATGESPWYGRRNLAWDVWALLFGSLEEGLVYSGVKSKDI
jgi:cation diffusion facilitator CzcD-associated flavoprotein CzcO